MTLLSGLTPLGRYEEAFNLVRIATVDPQQLDLTAEQGKELCFQFIKILCKEGRFNKAFETLELIRDVSNRHYLEGIKTLVESLGQRRLAKRAREIALLYPDQEKRILLLLRIAQQSNLIGREKFTEAAELILSIKTQLSEFKDSAMKFEKTWWLKYATLIHNTPQESLEKVGLRKTRELESIANQLLSKKHFKEVEQILDWIPAKESEAR